MTQTSGLPSLSPLGFEKQDSEVPHGLFSGLRTHISDLHGAPKTVTAKSVTDQTAQYIEALKRDAFGKHVEQESGEGAVKEDGESGAGRIVTQILDDPHAVRTDGGTEKYFHSQDTFASNEQLRNARPLSTGTFGSENAVTSQKVVERNRNRDGQATNGPDRKGSFDDSRGELLQNGKGNAHTDSPSAAEINPFHRLSFPDGSSPPWIAKPLGRPEDAIESGHALAPLVHIKRVSRDTVVLVPATPTADQIQQSSSMAHENPLFNSNHGQQLDLSNGHLTIVNTTEEKKTGFFGKFERAFGRTADGHASNPLVATVNGTHPAIIQPNVSADFLPQALPGESNEVHGNAPPSPPISEHDSNLDNNVPAPAVQRDTLALAFPNPFQHSRDSQALAVPARVPDENTLAGSSNALLSPRSQPTNLSVVSANDGLSAERSISGQSFTTEPEAIESEAELSHRHARRLPSINTSMLEGASSLGVNASADSSPSTNPATPADRAVVLAPPVLTGTTRSGSIAAIKRGIGKSPSATGSGRNSINGASSVDVDNRGASPASIQGPGRRMSSDRHSNKGRLSVDQNSQNALGLGAPSSPAQGALSLDATSLSPPPPIRPERRNTTNGSSSPKMPTRAPLISSQSQLHIPQPSGASQGFVGGLLGSRKRQMTGVPGLDGSALDPDILAEADRLRKERLTRRQRKKSESEDETIRLDGDALPMGQPSTAEEPHGDSAAARFQSQLKQKERQFATEMDRVLVGNLIGEDHVNYVLMYNMLTGIRIGVSRCQAKMKRPVTDADYTAKHKYSFDIVGNELTPSARYDFKFKDYAPWIFRELREDYFHLDPADYLLSLTAKYILSELGSPGKSGSFFYFSRDYRFIIKTIHHAEHKYLRSILKDYHQHVKDNPHTLLSRFYGLHRVKLPRGRKIHFVIMNNLFPPHRDIHETYDLKGSAWGREYPEEKAKQNPKATLKDMNWLHRGRTFELGPEKRALFSEQLRRDTEFLKKIGVMDYSLLIGIHNMERGNRDNIRENQLSVFHPDVGGLGRRKPSSVKGNSEAAAVRKIVKRSDPKAMSSAIQELPTIDSTDRRHFLFYQDEGGLRATDEANQAMDIIYYLGVIDILTPYNTVKRLEHLWRGTTIDRHMISCVPPQEYGERFLKFLLSFMRGADTSSRPKME